MSARGMLALIGAVLIFLIGLPLALLALSAGRWAEVGGELDALVNTLLPSAKKSWPSVPAKYEK